MLASGKRGILTDRDQKILTDLYLAPSQTNEQIARAHFPGLKGEPSPDAAERRLYKLVDKGYVQSHSVDTPQGNRRKVWTLSEQAYTREHRDLGSGEENIMLPRPGRLEHFLATNDLYAGTSGNLRSYFGEPGPDGEEGWSYRHEYLCEHQVTLGGRDRKVKPDAEILILDHTLYVETQTERSNKTVAVMQNKIEAYNAYFKYVLKEEGDTQQVLVMTNEPWIKRGVEEKGEELGVLVVAGDLETVCRHVEMTALRLS